MTRKKPPIPLRLEWERLSYKRSIAWAGRFPIIVKRQGDHKWFVEEIFGAHFFGRIAHDFDSIEEAERAAEDIALTLIPDMIQKLIPRKRKR